MPTSLHQRWQPPRSMHSSNKYPHSLFVADYAVTKDGKLGCPEYRKADFRQKLCHPAAWTIRCVRRPWEVASTGSGDSRRGMPQSNEWDTMLNKDERIYQKLGRRCFRGDRILGVLLRRSVRFAGTIRPATGITYSCCVLPYVDRRFPPRP